MIVVSTNLRLSDEAAAGLRRAAQLSGRSQQELLREALDQYLGLHFERTTREQAVESGLVHAPTPFHDSAPAIVLPEGVHSIDLLRRDDER